MRHLILISLCSLLWTACGNTDNDFDASGTFEATEILVSSEANGKIMELNIEEGDRLDAGAIVGYVDSTQLFSAEDATLCQPSLGRYSQAGYP